MEALRDDLRLALDRVAFAHKAFRFLPYGDRPDGWQEELLRSTSKRIILNCARQSGKTTAVAALALHTAIYRPRSFCLIYAPSQDQSTEFFKRVEELAHGLGMDAVNPEALRKTGMDLKNGSRIEARPGSARTARGRTADLIVIDEASWVEDNLYHSLRPSLAVTGERLVVLSTPYGKRGFFYEEWTEGEEWERYEVPAPKCPRITQDFLEGERRTTPEWWFRQEYFCEFRETEDQLFTFEMIERARDDDIEEYRFEGDSTLWRTA